MGTLARHAGGYRSEPFYVGNVWRDANLPAPLQNRNLAVTFRSGAHTNDWHAATSIVPAMVYTANGWHTATARLVATGQTVAAGQPYRHYVQAAEARMFASPR